MLGAIFSVLGYFLVVSNVSVPNHLSYLKDWFLGIPFFLSMLTGLGHIDIMNTGKIDFLAQISFLSITFLLYFIIGAFLGWLYGKIKNRNKSI